MRWLLLAVGVTMLQVAPAEPCATAPPRGLEALITDEEAVIVWDADKHVEHFIRKASFRTNAAAFGFLVPTPTTPDLGEVEDRVFYELVDQIRPEERIERSGLEPGCLLVIGGGDAKRGPPESVTVIQTARVAGFDATTIEGSDPAALAGWLGTHGFEATPALTAWLDGYVANHWKVTAFVVAGGAPSGERANDGSEIATRSVRMTFATDRPFYPYREPATPPEARAMPRLLRVFLLASQRYTGTLAGKPWVGAPFFAGPITVGAELAKLAGPHPVATVFLDPSSPRNGIDEVYFAPSPDQRVLHQPDYVIHRFHQVPLELIPLALIALYVLWRIWRRRHRS